MATALQEIVAAGVIAALQPQLRRLESKTDTLQVELNILRKQGIGAPASASSPQASTQPASDGPIFGRTGVAVAVDESVLTGPRRAVEPFCALACRTRCPSSTSRGSNEDLRT